MSYKVVNLEDDVYQVVVPYYNDEEEWEDTEYVYQGSLADCEAYIRLSEGGYL